jgi:hypothetical protein
VSALVEQTLAELTGPDPATVYDALLRAASFFEHAAGNPNPVEPEVATDPASPAELDALRDAVIEVVAGPTPNLVGASLWALGKHRDRAVVQFFVQWLVAHWRDDPHATHQALIGLNNFGEPTLSLEGQLSSIDPDLTMRQAEHYLRSLNLI